MERTDRKASGISTWASRCVDDDTRHLREKTSSPGMMHIADVGLYISLLLPWNVTHFYLSSQSPHLLLEPHYLWPISAESSFSFPNLCTSIGPTALAHWSRCFLLFWPQDIVHSLEDHVGHLPRSLPGYVCSGPPALLWSFLPESEPRAQ